MQPQRHSIQKRRNARLAAVQALYNADISGRQSQIAAVAQEILDQWGDKQNRDDPDWQMDGTPDKALLHKIIEGVDTTREAIDALVAGALKENWKMERMSPLLLAILRAAIFELQSHTQLSPNIIIDEYVTITANFFEGGEQSFVNGTLHNLAQQLRTGHE